MLPLPCRGRAPAGAGSRRESCVASRRERSRSTTRLRDERLQRVRLTDAPTTTPSSLRAVLVGHRQVLRCKALARPGADLRGLTGAKREAAASGSARVQRPALRRRLAAERRHGEIAVVRRRSSSSCRGRGKVAVGGPTMGVYERWLVARGNVFLPSAATVAKLIERLRAERSDRRSGVGRSRQAALRRRARGAGEGDRRLRGEDRGERVRRRRRGEDRREHGGAAGVDHGRVARRRGPRGGAPRVAGVWRRAVAGEVSALAQARRRRSLGARAASRSRVRLPRRPGHRSAPDGVPLFRGPLVRVGRGGGRGRVREVERNLRRV